MTTTIIIAIVSILAGSGANDSRIYTRQELLSGSFVNDRRMETASNPLRYKAEVDLNADGINELILSYPVSFGGTGGLVYGLYRGLGEDRYVRIDCFLAGSMALEDNLYGSGIGKRLWTYTHSSSQSGHVQYRFFDRKGVFKQGPGMFIFTGDGGTEMGNRIYGAIFTDATRLAMEEVKPPAKPEVPVRADEAVRSPE